MEEKLRDLIIAQLKIEPGQYSEELGAGDIPEWDSLAHMNLIMAVEKEFRITFDVADAVDLETVGDFQDALRRYQA
ncbi:acyl carrier protein [Cerasicoccus fimbriatus]|uniref:acyl carrier protein n=1 Tax=Cerasicoccus fimbriatus TaxID=3014554 RepID=UPI0022B41A51|nr:acyl carrier protein [Cerasicoccus sp. TK19100]